MTPNREKADRELLAFYQEAGVDALLCEAPVDRFADEPPAPAVSADPARPAGGERARGPCSEVRFNRLFASADVLDEVMRQGGLPDLGAVEERIGLPAVVDISSSIEGRDFRHWFWSVAAEIVGNGGDVSQAILERFAAASHLDVTSVQLAVKLKLRFFEQRGEEYLFGSTGGTYPRTGYALRAKRGRDALEKQRAQHRLRRRDEIRRRFGDVAAYDTCPCESGEKFRFCCGRPIT
jgi:hypothetical protein